MMVIVISIGIVRVYIVRLLYTVLMRRGFVDRVYGEGEGVVCFVVLVVFDLQFVELEYVNWFVKFKKSFEFCLAFFQVGSYVYGLDQFIGVFFYSLVRFCVFACFGGFLNCVEFQLCVRRDVFFVVGFLFIGVVVCWKFCDFVGFYFGGFSFQILKRWLILVVVCCFKEII